MAYRVGMVGHRLCAGRLMDPRIVPPCRGGSASVRPKAESTAAEERNKGGKSGKVGSSHLIVVPSQIDEDEIPASDVPFVAEHLQDVGTRDGGGGSLRRRVMRVPGRRCRADGLRG